MAERAELDEKAARVERLLEEGGLAGVIVGAQHTSLDPAAAAHRIDGSPRRRRRLPAAGPPLRPRERSRCRG